MAVSNPTPKQVRNGANTGAPGSGATMAKPGPNYTAEISSAMSSSESMGTGRHSREGLGTPDTTGTPESYGRYVAGG